MYSQQQYNPSQLMANRISQLLQQFVLPSMMQQQQLFSNELQYVNSTLQSGMLLQLSNQLTQPVVNVDNYGRQMQYPARQYSDQELCQVLWQQIGSILAYGRQNNAMPQYVSPPMGGGQQMMYGGQPAMNMVHPTNGMSGAMQPMGGQGMISPTQSSPLSNLYGAGGQADGNMIYPTNITPSIEVRSAIPTIIEHNISQQTTTPADIARATNTSQLAVGQQRNAPTTGDTLLYNVENSVAAGAEVLDRGLSDAIMPEYVVSASRQPTNSQLESRKDMLTGAGVQICRDTAMYNTSSGHDILYTQLDLMFPYSNWGLAKKDLYSSPMSPRMENIGSNYANIINYREMTHVHLPYDECKYDLDKLIETRKAIQPNLSKSGTFLTTLKNIRHQQLQSLLCRRFVDTFNDMARVWLLIGDDTYNETFVSITEPEDVCSIVAPVEQCLPELKMFTEQDTATWYENMIRCVFAAINSVCQPNVKCYLDMDDIDDQLIALSTEESGIRFQGMNGRQIAYNYDANEGIPTEVVAQLKKRIILVHENAVVHTRLSPTSSVIQLNPNEAISYEQTMCALDQIVLDYFKNSPNKNKLTIDLIDVHSIGRNDMTIGKTLNGRIAYYRRLGK